MCPCCSPLLACFGPPAPAGNNSPHPPPSQIALLLLLVAATTIPLTNHQPATAPGAS
nr:unnamed protein product [Digitaria exilis]